MNKRTYFLSILRYQPRIDLGEQLNIGLLYLFVEDSFVYFDFPKSLNRIAYCYPNIAIKALQEQLHHYQSLAASISAPVPQSPAEAEDFLRRYFGPEDSTSLEFDKPLAGIYFREREVVIERNHALYFSVYERAPLFMMGETIRSPR